MFFLLHTVYRRGRRSIFGQVLANSAGHLENTKDPTAHY